MGDWLNYLRPNWILLIILFWSQALPSRVGMWYGFVVGLLFDLLLDNTLGLTSISLVLVLYLQLLLHRQLKSLRGLQQALKVAIFSFLYLLSYRLLEEFFGSSVKLGPGFWLPILSNALIWPWFFILMESIKYRFGIYEPNN